MYDVLSAFFCKYKKAIVSISICVACVFAAFYSGYMLGIRNAGSGSDAGNHVSDYGTGISAAGEQLNQAAAAVSNAAIGINQAAGTAAKVSDGITAAEESAQYIQRAVDNSAAIIAECKSILAKIRARGKKEAP